MTHPDEHIRDSLRDLIPGYQGPADPYTRVGVAIRRRRSRQRMLVAIGSATAVAAVLIAVPLAVRGRLGGDAPAGGGGHRAGGEAVPGPVGPGQQVATGSTAAGAWTVRAVRLTTGAHRCLYADDAVFRQAAVCFDGWPAGGPVSWASVDALRPPARITAIFGVAASTIGSIILVLSDGTQQTVPTVAGADQPDTRFFALVMSKPQVTVRNVTTLATDGTLAQLAVTTSGSPPCRPTPAEPCTRPTG
ncbi:MAG: hypothetical protein V7637_5443 [Mycobacteriales bacterium]